MLLPLAGGCIIAALAAVIARRTHEFSPKVVVR
jgi:hypothetical protein